MKFISFIRGGAAATSLFLLTNAALAQDGLLAQDDATSGSTDVAAEGFKTAETAADATDATVFKIQAGGLFATGNSRSLALTGSSHFRLRRSVHQYTADLAANYARSAVERGEPMEDTVENYQARVRYDRFIGRYWALFVSQSARRDRFQGLNLRLNFDPGLAFYALDTEAQRLWFEAGYDMQLDMRTDEGIQPEEDGAEVLDKSETRHAVRLFAGYEVKFNEHVSMDTGLEYLQAFADTKNWRLNWALGINANVSDRFSLASTFNLRYDNNPLPDIVKLDTVTAMSLVYTLN